MLLVGLRKPLNRCAGAVFEIFRLSSDRSPTMTTVCSTRPYVHWWAVPTLHGYWPAFLLAVGLRFP